eukprot:jgi/Chlat1/204/Chrsp1S03120
MALFEGNRCQPQQHFRRVQDSIRAFGLVVGPAAQRYFSLTDEDIIVSADVFLSIEVDGGSNNQGKVYVDDCGDSSAAVTAVAMAMTATSASTSAATCFAASLPARPARHGATAHARARRRQRQQVRALLESNGGLATKTVAGEKHAENGERFATSTTTTPRVATRKSSNTYAANEPCASGLVTAVQRVRSDAAILAKGVRGLDACIRAEYMHLASELLRLDHRAREDTLKVDARARHDTLRLRYIALGLTETAQLGLGQAAAEHWNNGALEADLRLADVRARRRAMEDAYTAVQSIRQVHQAMVELVRVRAKSLVEELWRATATHAAIINSSQRPARPRVGEGVAAASPTDIESAWQHMLAAVSVADSYDASNTSFDTEEIELVLAALMDLGAVDSARGAVLVSECAKSPDAVTRRVLAEALGSAPSPAVLGNIGVATLQRLAEDPDQLVSSTAAAALERFRQWYANPGDGLTFNL